MSVHLPEDPSSPPLNTSRPIYKTQEKESVLPQPPSPSVAKQDSVEAALINETTASLIFGEKGIPTLTLPQTSDTSIVGSFKAWTKAARAFSDQLQASDLANLESRSKFTLLAAQQAEEFSKVLAEKEAGIANLQKEIETKLSALQKKLNDMQKLNQTQQQAIDKVNAGNEKEQQAYADLATAYDNYLSKLKSIGAIDLGNGTFSIPESPLEAVEKFNLITKDYQKAVTTFNQYWKERSAQINTYNSGTLLFNQQVREETHAINDYISKNNLSDNLKKNGIVIPQLSQSTQRDLSGYEDEINFPSLTKEPASVNIPPLPTYVKSIANKAPSIPNLPPFLSFDTHILYTEMYHMAYESRIAPFDQELVKYNNYHTFIKQSVKSIDSDLSTEDLLNSRKLAQELLSFKPSRPQSDSINFLTLQTLGLDNRNVQILLGELLLKEVISQSELKIFQGVNAEKKEAQVGTLTGKMILLSLGLLGNNSMQALFPSLGMISEQLPSLPKHSPAFAILFAVSLSNRISEDIKQGISAKALQQFLSSTPELATMPAKDKVKLEAALNVGQLLVASKLLEETLGLQGLFAQLLPSLSPDLPLNQMHIQATKEDKQSQIDLTQQVKNHFSAKGYEEDKAEFFADLGAELMQQGLLAPNATGNISEKTIHFSLLKNSLTAEIAFSKQFTLQEARSIANEAISSVFASASIFSPKQFRSALESHLQDLSIKNSHAIAMAVALIPLPERVFSISESQLSPTELAVIVEKRVIQLMTPQLGPQVAKEVGQEVIHTLFGQRTLDSHNKAPNSSPYALINVIGHQLDQLDFRNHEKGSDALHSTFKESIKTMTSFAEFGKKLLDPAYKYVLASTIIHGDPSSKKAIDIAI